MPKFKEIEPEKCFRLKKMFPESKIEHYLIFRKTRMGRGQALCCGYVSNELFTNEALQFYVGTLTLPIGQNEEVQTAE